MDWINTPESSNISKFGYDESTRVLAVEFKTGSTYEYFDVPKIVFQQMKAAPSRGQFLAQAIKGSYRYTRR